VVWFCGGLRFGAVKKPPQNITPRNANDGKVQSDGNILSGRGVNAQERQNNKDEKKRNAKANGGICAGFYKGLFFCLAHYLYLCLKLLL
tara:strand:- start:758 stop:1024 length:267 start_codon:yes stop_codon:yes gene_type:complete